MIPILGLLVFEEKGMRGARGGKGRGKMDEGE